MSPVKRRIAQKIAGTKTRRAVKKPTSLRFKKDYEVEDGRASREEMQIDAELRTADVARGSRKPSVTVGSKSEAGGVVAESTSRGGRKAGERKAELSAKKRDGTATKKELKELERLRARDLLDKVRADVKGGATRSANAKKIPKGTYMNRNTGEVFEDVETKADLPKGAKMDDFIHNPTKNQIESLGRSAKIKARLERTGNTGSQSDARRMLEKRNPKDKDVKMGNVTLGTRKADMAKGGAVKKKATGHMDYRMNKGGLLLSSVDNRKKK